MKIAGLDLSISSSGIVIEELDDNFEKIKVEYFGFSPTKKHSLIPGITYYNTKDFFNDYQRYQFFCKHIVNICKDCTYIAIEDYAYSMSGTSGLIFSLAEFEGNIKFSLFRNGHKLKFYTPNQNKKFFTSYGSADKIRMYNSLNQRIKENKEIELDISALPPVNNGKKGTPPTSDIIDAYALCEFLRKELRIHNNIEHIEDQEKYIKECFLTISKENPKGLLFKPFIENLI